MLRTMARLRQATAEHARGAAGLVLEVFLGGGESAKTWHLGRHIVARDDVAPSRGRVAGRLRGIRDDASLASGVVEGGQHSAPKRRSSTRGVLKRERKHRRRALRRVQRRLTGEKFLHLTHICNHNRNRNRNRNRATSTPTQIHPTPSSNHETAPPRTSPKP